jgi:hypothetical protein
MASVNEVLRQFEITEANVAKLEEILAAITELTPTGLYFGRDRQHEDRIRAYGDVLQALLAIDGWKPKHIPLDINSVGELRLDAAEVGEITAESAVPQQLDQPEKELAEYRHKLNKKRRQVIRSTMQDLIAKTDAVLVTLKPASESNPENDSVGDPAWEKLKKCVSAIDMLLGSGLPRPPRWADLRRHLSFGLVQELRDIIRLDWPEVKKGLQQNLYHADEPIPVGVDDQCRHWLTKSVSLPDVTVLRDQVAL